MKKGLLIIAAINVLRLILIPVLNTEAINLLANAYNWQSDHQPETIIQYFYATLAFFNLTSPAIIKIIYFFISVLAQWCLFVFISKIIRPERKYSAWLAISSTVIITVLSIAPFADGLVCLFWLLAIITIYNAIFENDNKSWLLSGLFMGFAILLKLSGIGLTAGLLIFLIFSSRYRYHLFSFGPYASLLIATFLSLPVWLGIIATESASVSIEFANSFLTSFGYSFNSFTTFLLFQLLMVFPVLYIGLWWVTFKYLARIFDKPNQVNAEFWFLLSFFLPLFVGFHLIALFDWVDMLGLAPIYLTGSLVFLKLAKTRWFNYTFALAIIFHIFFIASILIN